MIHPLQFLWRQLNGPQVTAITQAIYEFFKESFDDLLDYFNWFNLDDATPEHTEMVGLLNEFSRPILLEYRRAFFFFTYRKEQNNLERGFSTLSDRLHGGKFSALSESTRISEKMDIRTYKALLKTYISSEGQPYSLKMLDDICQRLVALDAKSPSTQAYYFLHDLRCAGSITVDIGYTNEWNNPHRVQAVIESLAKTIFYPEPMLDVMIQEGERPTRRSGINVRPGLLTIPFGTIDPDEICIRQDSLPLNTTWQYGQIVRFAEEACKDLLEGFTSEERTLEYVPDVVARYNAVLQKVTLIALTGSREVESGDTFLYKWRGRLSDLLLWNEALEAVVRRQLLGEVDYTEEDRNLLLRTTVDCTEWFDVVDSSIKTGWYTPYHSPTVYHTWKDGDIYGTIEYYESQSQGPDDPEDPDQPEILTYKLEDDHYAQAIRDREGYNDEGDEYRIESMQIYAWNPGIVSTINQSNEQQYNGRGYLYQHERWVNNYQWDLYPYTAAIIAVTYTLVQRSDGEIYNIAHPIYYYTMTIPTKYQGHIAPLCSVGDTITFQTPLFKTYKEESAYGEVKVRDIPNLEDRIHQLNIDLTDGQIGFEWYVEKGDEVTQGDLIGRVVNVDSWNIDSEDIWDETFPIYAPVSGTLYFYRTFTTDARHADTFPFEGVDEEHVMSFTLCRIYI